MILDGGGLQTPEIGTVKENRGADSPQKPGQ